MTHYTALLDTFTHLVAVVPGLDEHVLAGDGAAERGGRGAVRGRHELGLLALGAPIGARVPRLVGGLVFTLTHNQSCIAHMCASNHRYQISDMIVSGHKSQCVKARSHP